MGTESDIATNKANEEFLKEWSKRYEKTYAFRGSYNPGETNQNFLFYEGLHELAKHIATSCIGASCEIKTGANGLTQLIVNVSPKT